MRELLGADCDADLHRLRRAARAATSTSRAAREAAANIHIGIDWLSSRVVRPHHEDRQARHRAGRRQHRDGLLPLVRDGWAASDVQVVVRSGFDEMKASPWEKEDAMHEGIPILNYHRAQGVHARRRQADRRRVREGRAAKGRQGPAATGADRRARRALRRATTCWSRSGRRTRSRGSSATSASRSTSAGMPGRRPARRWPSTLPQRVLRRRRGIRPEEHHLGRRARPRRGDLDRPLVPRRGRSTKRPPPHVNLVSQKMGIHEWSYDNAITQRHQRYRVPLKDTVDRAGEHQGRGRARLRPASSRSPRRSAASTATCRRCSPTSCASSATPASTSARWTASRSPPIGDEAELRTRLQAPGDSNLTQDLYVSRRRSRPGA